VTPVSHNTHRVFKELLVKYHVPVPPITVIHNGVWMRDHLLPSLSTEEKGEPVILSVGAIKVRKGIFEVLQGIAALKKLYGIAVTYRIVGSLNAEDAYVKRLRAYAAASGIADQLVFTGRVSDAQVEDELRRAHILALLPRKVGNLLEGFGLVYLEANAYGVPALGARGTVSEEAIREGESGVLVDAESPDDIARGIKVLLDGTVSPLRARAWAEEHDWSKIVDQYRTVYEAAK
jgi:phosphatidylinositol alpha-1,6-mannosyltransferase